MVQRNAIAAFPFAGSGKGQLAFGKNDALVLTAEAAGGWVQAELAYGGGKGLIFLNYAKPVDPVGESAAGSPTAPSHIPLQSQWQQLREELVVTKRAAAENTVSLVIACTFL